MRLFVAVDLSGDTRAQLRRAREGLERLLGAARRAPRVTWVADEAAHVTVRFIGEVADASVERVRTALVAPIPLAPYDMAFSGLGVFPNGRRARTVWIGTPRGQEETAAVAVAVNGRLDPIVGAGEARPFRAHLTVGRIKEPVPFDWDAAFASIDTGTSISPIDHVTLYASRTGPKGPTYTPICTTALVAGHTT